MTPTEYLTEAARTDTKDYGAVVTRMIDPRTDLGNPKMVDCAVPNEETLQVLHGAMGVCTEAGEMMDAVKKLLIYGKKLDRTNVIEEMGDLFWYLSLIARALDFTFEEAMERNIAKLQSRYPEKFTEQLALNRDLGAERSVLEGGAK